jgi:predicted metalloprotease
MVPLTIIAHDWGHHIENLANPLGFHGDARYPHYSIQMELRADCYARLYIRYAQD